MFVAVLPNGTVEHGDPVYLYTKDHFTSHTVKEVSVTSDGEDVVAFGNAYFQYKATSKKGYRELDLSLKNDHKPFDISLTRLYDLPLSVGPVTDKPRIWTGIFNFHEYATTESIIIIAPKGVGHDQPVVCLWQWSKDQHGVKNTLSTSHTKQQYDATKPSLFSFKQGDYYTLDCTVNATTKGLDVMIKSPSHSDTGPLQLKSAEVKFGSDHHFAPPRPTTEKVQLECSAPRSTPALPRITGLLPFPGNLVDTLTYSAAFVDQAGHLAKYAVAQFNQLEKSFQQLEIKSEARGAKVVVLESQVQELTDKNIHLESDCALLKKQMADAEKLAERTQADLRKKLEEVQNLLIASNRRAKNLQKENDALKCCIEVDRLADIMRDIEVEEGDARDRAIIEELQGQLKKSQESERILRRREQEKERTITELETKLKIKKQQLKDSEATVNKLRNDLKKEKNDRKRMEDELRQQLESEKTLHEATHAKLIVATSKIASLECELEKQTALVKQTEAKLKNAQDVLKKTEETLSDTQKRLQETQSSLDEARESLDETRHTLQETRSALDQAKDKLDDAENDLKNTKEDLDDAKKDLAETKANLAKEKVRYKELDDVRKEQCELLDVARESELAAEAKRDEYKNDLAKLKAELRQAEKDAKKSKDIAKPVDTTTISVAEVTNP